MEDRRTPNDRSKGTIFLLIKCKGTSIEKIGTNNYGEYGIGWGQIAPLMVIVG